MNTPVSFELAKLLKDKEFDKYTYSGYTEKGKVYLHQGGQEPIKNGQLYYEGRNYNGGQFYCSAPTIAEVVMWLYEKHGIWMVAWKNPDNPFQFYFEIDTLVKRIGDLSLGLFNSPTEAYEAAIEYVFKNLI